MPKNILLINYDNGSRWPVLPQNLIILGSAMAREGNPVSIVDFNLTKEPYEALEKKMRTADIIGLGFVSGYWPHKEAIKIAHVINNSDQRPHVKFIIGGHAPSSAPEYYKELLTADAVFVGSADFSLREWIRKGCEDGIIESMGFDPNVLTYRAYPQGNHLDVYKRIKFPNTDENEFAIQLLSGRGCPYKCAFCTRIDQKFIHYEIHYILEQIRLLYQDQHITHFQFSDELLMSDNAFIHTLCEGLIHIQEKIGLWMKFDCNGRLNMATFANLSIMKRAGFSYINYGCESMSNEVLELMNKKQTQGDIVDGIENTISIGISPGINFMWGSPGDNLESLNQARNFIIEHGDGCELRTIRPVTPYPGSPLFLKLIEDGRLTSRNPVDEFYENHTNSDLFSYQWLDGFTNAQADAELFHANMDIIENYRKQKADRAYNQARDFYLHKGAPGDFRGFREV